MVAVFVAQDAFLTLWSNKCTYVDTLHSVLIDTMNNVSRTVLCIGTRKR